MIKGLLRSATHKIGMKDSGALDHDMYLQRNEPVMRFPVSDLLTYQKGVFPIMNLAAIIVIGATESASDMTVAVNYFGSESPGQIRLFWLSRRRLKPTKP
jgi:hypothetical protein